VVDRLEQRAAPEPSGPQAGFAPLSAVLRVVASAFMSPVELVSAALAHQQKLVVAPMSMARLWRDQGKRDEARGLLAPVYGWITEGFDTLDLKEAKGLLDELA
jgi:predicted ATPase